MATAQRKCGKCEKTVYPAEEIKCLDKVSVLIRSYFSSTSSLSTT